VRQPREREREGDDAAAGRAGRERLRLDLGRLGYLVVGLFVADWRQTLVIVIILAAAWAALAGSHRVIFAILLVVLLALQLVYFTMQEAERRRRDG